MRLSVIIPTLNEEAAIGPALDALPPGLDVVIADGGSTDATVERAAARARIVPSCRGRSWQMNAGAAAARGDVLLFLHVDSRLPGHAVPRIAETVDQGFVGGGFLGRFDSDHWIFRFGYPFRDWRTRTLKEIYGDQGIFVRRDVFERMGGFRPIPILEDLDLVRRLRRLGGVRVIAEPIRMSARRYLRYGILRQHLKNFWIRHRYLSGADPWRLHGLYERYWERA